MSRLAAPAKPKPGPRNAADDDGDDADLQPTRVFSSVASAGVSKPASAPNSVFQAGKMAKPVRRVSAPIDLGSVVIETDVPLPDRHNSGAVAALRQSCLTLLQKMQPGHSVLLPAATAMSLMRVAKAHSIKAKRVTQPDGTVRVWRLVGAQAGSAS